MAKYTIFLLILCLLSSCGQIDNSSNNVKKDKPDAVTDNSLSDKTGTDEQKTNPDDQKTDNTADQKSDDTEGDDPPPVPDNYPGQRLESSLDPTVFTTETLPGSCDEATCPAGQYCQNNYFGHLCRCPSDYYFNDEGECQKLPHVQISLMAANITSGSEQTYIGPGIRIIKALKPDIAMLQEFSYKAEYDDDYGYNGRSEMVYRAFGPEYTYFAGQGKIPNGIVSRYPILESGNWDDGNGDRDFAWAIIDIPGDKDLLAVSLHIKAGHDQSDKKERNKQSTKLLTAIENKLGKRIADYYLAIGGDFNLTGRNEYAFTMLNKYFAIKEPYPADQNGNNYSNANRDHPYDGVFVDTLFDSLEVPVIIGKSTFTDGLLFDSRVYTPLSEVAPVLKTDCEPKYSDGTTATNMQHMAILKNFQLW